MKSDIPQIDLPAFNNNFGALEYILKSYINGNVYTCQPVEVVKAHDGLVDVKPLLINTTVTGEKIPITDNDIIYNIPFMKFKGKYFNLSLKAEKDDKGLLIAIMRDISKYKKDHKQSVIGSKRAYSSSDGVFLPFDFDDENGGGISFQNTNAGINIGEDTVTINCQTANITAEIVNIGGENGMGVARIGDSVDLETGKITTGSTKVKAV